MDNSLLSVPWYYTVEVEKGIFTKGLNHPNLGLTRKLLRNINVRNKACIDIGTQEALVPILLKRAGAKRVVGYDRFDLSQKVSFLCQIYQSDIEYVGGIELHKLPNNLDKSEGGRLFDLVVFSGVLYHTINPFGLLALTRGLCNIGGLFLIETAAIQHPKEILFFNARGEVYGPSSNYFIPSTSWLEYALRLLGLTPLEAVYLGEITKEIPIRLAILCRSQASPRPLSRNDEWALQAFHSYVFSSEAQFDWKNLAENEGQMDYVPFDASVLGLNDKSLYDELNNHPQYIPSHDEIILTLESQI